MKKKNARKYILFLVIILTLYFLIKYTIIIFKYDGIIFDKRMYKKYNEVIDASSENFSIDPINFFKFYYNEDADYFFSENKYYEKVSQENIDEISSYFDFIFNNYYNEKIFPKDFSPKEIINENDYYYILDDSKKYNNLYKKYEKFEFYY